MAQTLNGNRWIAIRGNAKLEAPLQTVPDWRRVDDGNPRMRGPREDEQKLLTPAPVSS